MKIEINKVKGGYYADFIELPGSPKIGTGKTIAEAVATLFIRNYKKLELLDFDYLEINNKPFEDI